MPPEPIRVLIVDDSVVVRRAVSDALTGDSEISVVGTAANGKIALDRVAQLRPDVLVLDIEMPEADGFAVLRALRRDYPKVRTIMFSTLTQRGAAQTIEALSLGASDYASKPSTVGKEHAGDVIREVAAELIPKIKQFRVQLRPERLRGVAKPVPRPVVTSRAVEPRVAPRVVAIGISTGGPEALSKLLPRLSCAFPVPIVLVQHMPPLFTRLLAERLGMSSQIKVVEGADGMILEAGAAYVAPGDFHMTLRRDETHVRIALNQSPPENSCRPAVDPLFRSVAQVYGSQALGVIMTGMGQDGLLGLREMREQGATIFAQDQASSVVWGMPAGPVREGLADRVVSLDGMSEAIEACVTQGLRAVPAA